MNDEVGRGAVCLCIGAGANNTRRGAGFLIVNCDEIGRNHRAFDVFNFVSLPMSRD